jgi:hypothetical protein
VGGPAPSGVALYLAANRPLGRNGLGPFGSRFAPARNTGNNALRPLPRCKQSGLEPVSRLHAAFVGSAENVVSGPTMENVEPGASISPTYAFAAWLRVDGCNSLFDSISYLPFTMPLLAAKSNHLSREPTPCYFRP